MASRVFTAHYLDPFQIDAPVRISVVAPDVIPTVASGSIEVVAPDATYAIEVGVGLVEVVAPDAFVPTAVLLALYAYARDGGVVQATPGFVEPPVLPDPYIPDINPLPLPSEEIDVPLPPWIPDVGPYRKS